MAEKNSPNKNSVIKSLIWKFAERCGAQVSSFVVSMVLARILMPEEYGVLSVLLIFITLSQVIVQSGLGTALIQKKEPDNKDYSSVFYVSIALSIVLYGVLYIFSPFIAVYFDMPVITSTLRVMSVSLFFGAGTAVLNSKLAKEMKFDVLCVCNITSSLLSGILGIFLAYHGFGVWALVYQHIANQAVALFVMEVITRWIPCGISSVKNVKPLFKYGYKILVANLISTGYNEMRSLVIGKKYNSATLAYYDKGKQFPHLIISNINTTIDNVMLPVYSKAQNDPQRLKQQLSLSIRTSSYVVFPMLAGLCIISKTLVSVLITDAWLPCVPFLIINSLTYVLTPLQTANAQVINAMGRSDIFLKLEIIKKTLGIGVLVLSVVLFDDVLYIAYGGLVVAVLSSLINMYPNTKLINYSYKEQFFDLIPNTLITIVMTLAVWSVSFVIDNKYLLISSQIIVGFIVYILLSVWTKNSSFNYFLSIFKTKMLLKDRRKNEN